MPTYCFTNEDGHTIDRFFSTEDVPKRVKNDGKWYRRDIASEHREKSAGNGWPLLSSAVGVLPSQIQKAAMKDKELGVPTDYAPDGRVKFESRGHRAKWLKAHKMVDHDGGYGDG